VVPDCVLGVGPSMILAPASRCSGGVGRMDLWRFFRICAGPGCLHLACGPITGGLSVF